MLEGSHGHLLHLASPPGNCTLATSWASVPVETCNCLFPSNPRASNSSRRIYILFNSKATASILFQALPTLLGYGVKLPFLLEQIVHRWQWKTQFICLFSPIDILKTVTPLLCNLSHYLICYEHFPMSLNFFY